MNKEYKKTTFGEWCKRNNSKGKILVFCKECGIVQDDRNIKLIDVKTCPKCEKSLKNFVGFEKSPICIGSRVK